MQFLVYLLVAVVPVVVLGEFIATTSLLEEREYPFAILHLEELRTLFITIVFAIPRPKRPAFAW